MMSAGESMKDPSENPSLMERIVYAKPTKVSAHMVTNFK
jgi:hypothetical protein